MDDEVPTPRKVFAMARQKPPSVVDQILSPLAKAPPPAAARPLTPDLLPSAAEPEALPPPKKTDPLPEPGDAYRACAQFMNRLGGSERMIDFVDKDCYSEAFNYSDLRRVGWRKPQTPGSGPVLVLRFIEASVFEVWISGRNLEDIRHYIREGMMPWVWEQPANFRASSDQMTVITGIEIQEIRD